jgi:phage-related protein (TIGR01555 family)
MQKQKSQSTPDLRADGWANLLTGIGIKGRDKTAHTTYIADNRLEYHELTQMYRGDGLARRLVDLPVHDMFREWFTIEGDTDGVIDTCLSKLNARKSLKRAQRFGYLYGGALAILGINDGGMYFDPVNEKKIKSIEHIHVFDRWRVTLNTADLYVDPNLDKYGKPEYYNIVPIYGAPFRVHESRVLRFEGVDVADQMRIQNQGWGDSVLQSVYDRLRGLGESYLNIENILDEFILGVLTIDNLQELIANGKEALIQKRLSQIDLSKHIINSILVDKEEKFERHSTTTTGLKELMDVLIEGVSAARGIPVCLLMGRSVGGLGSEDASLVRLYYDLIASQQEEDLRPQLEQLIRYINIANNNVLGEEWKICFNSLWQPTQKDEVATKLVQAQADQIYIANGVLLPEEVALARFGGDHYSSDMALSPVHQSELEIYKQTPDDSESVISEVKREEENTITKPEDRLGALKTTDLKTMAMGSPLSGAVKDVISEKKGSC